MSIYFVELSSHVGSRDNYWFQSTMLYEESHLTLRAWLNSSSRRFVRRRGQMSLGVRILSMDSATAMYEPVVAEAHRQ